MPVNGAGQEGLWLHEHRRALTRAGRTVCAPEGSTNIDDDQRDPGNGFDEMVILAKPDISDCLVAMQQGEADATTGDDTVLAGLAAQDPNTEVVGETFTDEPYGLGHAPRTTSTSCSSSTR